MVPRPRSRSSSTSSTSSSTSSDSASSTTSSTSTASSVDSRRKGSARSSPERRRSKSADRAKSPEANTRVSVRNISRNVKKEHLLEIFGIYGPINDTFFPMNKFHPTFPRGTAIIEYEKHEDAEKAIKHMDGGQVDGLVLQCEWKPPTPKRRSRSPVRRLSPPRRGRRSPSPGRRSPRRSPRRRSPERRFGRRSPPRFRRSRSPRRRSRSPRRRSPVRRITGSNNVPLGRGRRSESP